MGDRAMQLRTSGVPVLFSYEEALGYCVGDVTLDKDGITAASVFYEMASELAATGGEGNNTPTTVMGLLRTLSNTYGEFVSYNSYIICRDSTLTDKIFARLRTNGEGGKGYWKEAAGAKIVSLQDVTLGYDSTNTVDHSSSLPTTPESHMLMYEFDNGCSVTLRTR